MHTAEKTKRYRMGKYDIKTDKTIISTETFTAEQIEALGGIKIDENGETIK